MTLFRPAALAALEAGAHQAAVAEREFREGYAREIARLESERQRSWRRFNFVAALVAADAGSPDRETSRADQRRAALDELDWQESDPSTAELLDAMVPLADAVHDERLLAEQEAAVDPEAPIEVSLDRQATTEERAPAILFALSAFEARYEELKGRPFVAQFDRTFAETPLVDF